jgi:Na+-translocating ferredoxin:NAD+ oxidoreductase RnfD subunit
VSAPAAAARRPASVALKRFFRTPKGLLIVLLAILTITAAFGSGFRLVAPVVLGGLFGAVIVDAPILRWREKEWVVPDGAILTGLIVAMVLSPMEPWYVAAITAAIGVLSKYVLRVGRANVFNPAALALVATFYWFNTGQSWWGALPEITPFALVLLFATGIFITDRVNKIPVMLSFLGSYYLLVTLTAFAGEPAKVAELYRTPDLHAALFFAFFMVTDPPTSPPRQRDQLVYGAITAVVSYAVFELIGAAYFLLAGLLVANVWEATRKVRRRDPGPIAGSPKPEA